MAKQVIKLGLEFDTKSAIASYRQLVSEMQKGGADPKAIKQFTAAIEKAETELAQLAAEGSTGFTDSKGIEQYQKKVLKTVTSMQQLALRMQDFSKEGKNFPLSEAGQLEKKIKDLKKAVTDLAEEAKKNLQASLKNMGFSKTQAAEIANAVKTEEELKQRLEQERQLRQKNLDLAREQAQASVDAARGTKASSVESNSTRVKALTSGVDKISGVNPEAIKETVAEAFRSGIRKGVNNANDIVADLKKIFAQQFGEGTEITNALSEMLDKGLEASGDNISGWLNSIALKTGEALNPEKFKDLVAALNQVSVAQTDVVAGQFGAKMQESAQAAQDAAAAEGQLGTATTNTNKVLQQSEQAASGIAGSMEQAAQGFIKTSDAEKQSLKSTEALEGGFNKLTERLKYMFGFTAMFNRLRQIIRSTFNDIQELDKAYASIAYVTNETVGSLWKTYGDYAEMAEKLGQSTADVIKASAIYRQQGLDTAQALELTTDTMKLATIAGNDYSTATQEMTAALRGFKMEMDEGSHVSDVYSELAAHAAASVDDIAQAMSRTASIANSAGMSFENTSAFLTQMIETTQESAENIGTSMKTIIARFTELKNNVAGTADSEFEDLDFNKVDIALKSVGVSLKDTTGQFRNLDDVFLELSEKWSTLDRNTQRYIATVAAGSRQQSRFIAMMDNYERTIELIDTVADSEGKADAQFAKAADTVEFKLNAIKTQWEEFKLGLMDSSFVKGILDRVNNVLSGLKNMKMPGIAIGSALAIPAAKSFITTFIQNAKRAATSLQTLGKFIATKIPKLNFQANVENIDTKIKEIKDKIQRVNASRDSKIELKITKQEEFDKTSQAIEVLKEKIEALKLAEGNNEPELAKMNAELDTLQQQANKDFQELVDLTNQINNQAAVLEKADKELKQYEIDMEAAQVKSQGMSQAFSFVGQSLSMVIGMLISGAKATDIFKTVLYSMAIQTIPVLINTFSAFIAMRTAQAKADAAVTTATEMKKRQEYLKTAAVQKATMMTNFYMLAAAAAIAVAAGLALVISKHHEYMEALKTENRLIEQQKRVEEAKNRANSAKSTAKESKEEADHLEEIVNRYEELNKLTIKTTEEQEEYNNLIEEIKNDYPEIIDQYDEAAGKLTIQKDNYEQILKLKKEIAAIDAREAALAESSYIGEQIIQRQLQAKSINEHFYPTYQVIPEIVNGIDISQNNTKEIGDKAISELVKQLNISPDKLYNILGVSGKSSEEEWDKVISKLQKEGTTDLIEELEKLRLGEVESREKTIETLKEQQNAIVGQNIADRYGLNYNIGKSIAEYASNNTDVSNNKQIKDMKNWQYSNAGTSLMAGLGAAGVATLFNPIAGAVTLGAALIESSVEGLANNLDKWSELTTEEQKAWQLTFGSENITDAKKNYDDIRKDPEKYGLYIDDFASNLSIVMSEKLSTDLAIELQSNDKIQEAANDLGKRISEGSIDPENIEREKDILNGVLANNYASLDMTNYLDSMLDDYANAAQELKQNMAEALGMSDSDFKGWNKQELEGFKQYYQGIVDSLGGGEEGSKAAKEYIASMKNEFKNQFNNDKDMLNLFENIDFSQANVYNWEEFKENSIQTIMNLMHVSEEEAEKTFNKMAEAAKKANIYKEALSYGDVKSIESQITAREEALEKHKDIIDKIFTTNKPLKLTQTEIKNLKKTIEDLSATGVKLDLSKYLKGDTLDAEAFNEALKDGLMFSLEKLDKAIGELEKNGAEDSLIQSLKAVKEMASSFNTGAVEIFKDGWSELDRSINDTAKDLENVDKVMNQFTSDGYVNAESIEIISSLLTDQNDLYKYVDSNLALNVEGLKELIHTELEDIKVKYAHGEATAYQVLKLAALEKQITNTEKEWDEQSKDLEDKHKKAMEDYAKAQEDVTEKQKALNEAIAEYNKLLYGSDNRQSGLDLLYNYKQAISAFADEMTRAQEILEDSKSVNEASSALSRYTSAAHQRLAYMQAEGTRYDAGLTERRSQLLSGATSYTNELTGNTTTINFGDYVKYNADTGLMAIDQKLIQDAKIADEWKDYIEKQVDDYNKLSQESLKNQDEIRKLEKEIQKRREDAIKKYADFEKDIAETLKAQYQEQVDNLKNKYDSMKEADDDYLDALQEAIEKQRKLRERENQWEDLAQKQKKLSLMQRDTSGANAIETQKLEKEIQKDREQLLDESIDSAIENMQKLAEKQDELRQTEVELKEALLENTMYWNQQAEGVAAGFETAEDYVEWFKRTAVGLNAETGAQFENTMNEARNKFGSASEEIAWRIQDDMSQTGDSVTETITVTGEEIENITKTTSDTFVDEVSNTFERTKQSFNDNMEQAIEKVHNAQTALQEAINKLNEASAAAKAASEEIARLEYQMQHQTQPSSTPPTDAENYGMTGTYEAQKGIAANLSSNLTKATIDQYMQTYDQSIMSGAVSTALHDSKGMTWNDANNAADYATGSGGYSYYSGAWDNNTVQTLKNIGLWVASLGNSLLFGDKDYSSQAYSAYMTSTYGQGKDKIKQYLSGGLVNYTGPAWVDGSTDRPEAFLSADDTERIGNAAKLLSDIPALNRSNISTNNSTYGDTNIEINLNIDHISSDVDIEEMLDRVKQEIVDIARPVGTNVILQQQV